MISESSQIVKESKTYEFGEFRLEAENFLLLRNNQTVQLPMKAVQILLALVEADGRVLKKEEILERVWADTFVEEANLTHHISALRKALGEEKNSKKFIETIPRRGYRFVAQVEEITNGAVEITINERTQTRIAEEEEIEISEPQPIENVSAESTQLETSALPEYAARKTRRSWRSAALAGTIAVVAFAAIGFALYKFINPAAMRFEAKNISRLTSTGRVNFAATSPDGKFIVYRQEEMDEWRSLWIRHIGSESNTQITAPANNKYWNLNISPDGNYLYYTNEQYTLYQMPVLGGAAKKVMENVQGGFAFSPDGKQIAFVRVFGNDASSLFIANIDGTNERTLASFERPIVLKTFPAWSPDGKIIACPIWTSNSDNVLAVRVADGGTSAPILPKNWMMILQLVWLPDSKSLLAVGIKDSSAYLRQIWQISYPSGEARQITNDISNYGSIRLTSDGRFLAAVREGQIAHIWAMPSDDASRARQLTDGFEKFDGTFGLGWLSDSKIAYASVTSGKVSIWTTEADGSNPTQVVKYGAFPAVSPDGRSLVYQKGSPMVGDIGLYRMDLSDGSEKQITKGTDSVSTFTPDGKWVVFTRWGEHKIALWKVPSEGGEPTQILIETAINPAISPDGKTIAFTFTRPRQNLIGLVSFDGGEIIKTFDAKLQSPPTSSAQKLQWTADGRGIYFVAFENGASNIWQQPIDGSAPVQVTNFKDGRIFNFAFSADGSQLALSRGTFNSDVVLIENANSH